MTRDRLKPTPHQGFSDCTHVRRLKNRAKPHGEAVSIFWLGELQVKRELTSLPVLDGYVPRGWKAAIYEQ